MSASFRRLVVHPLGLSTALMAAHCLKQPPAAAPSPTPPTDAAPQTDTAGGATDPASQSTPELPDAATVLDRAVRALGGQAALEAVHSYYSKGSLEVVGQGLTTVVEIWWQRGDFYMRSDMQGLGVAHLWKHGDTIWADDPVHGRRRLAGERARQAALDTELALAASWHDHFDRAQTVANRAVDGQARVDVAFATTGSPGLTMSFDADSGLPIGHTTVRDTSMGALPVTTTLDDYREVGGILMPFRSVVSMSLYESVLRVEAFDVGVPIDPATFDP